MKKIVNINLNISYPLTTEELQNLLALGDERIEEPTITHRKNDSGNMPLTRLFPFYNNGAHAGNIYYRIEAWGMNSLKVEAEIKNRLEEFISQLQVGWHEI